MKQPPVVVLAAVFAFVLASWHGLVGLDDGVRKLIYIGGPLRDLFDGDLFHGLVGVVRLLSLALVGGLRLLAATALVVGAVQLIRGLNARIIVVGAVLSVAADALTWVLQLLIEVYWFLFFNNAFLDWFYRPTSPEALLYAVAQPEVFFILVNLAGSAMVVLGAGLVAALTAGAARHRSTVAWLADQHSSPTPAPSPSPEQVSSSAP